MPFDGVPHSRKANGNVTNDGTNAYTWNAAAQLATVNTTGGVYTYNINNQRTKKVAGGVTTYYIYGMGGLLIGEYTTAGAMVREYVYLNGEPLAQIDAGSPQVLTYLHTDHLGTPRYATNAAGTQVWAWTADAFGTSTPTGTATVNLRMPGQYYDAESTLFYNWNRYYKPSIGRYISSDPIGLAGGLNTFSYVGQNPVNRIDFLGLKKVPRDFVGPLQSGDSWAPPSIPFGSCLATCAGELFSDMTAVEGASLVAGTSIPKSWIGQPRALGSGALTNVGGALALLGEGLPRLKKPILRTTNICRVASRANTPVAAALATYDSAALLSCTAICVGQGGL